jgi:hypothetical protein
MDTLAAALTEPHLSATPTGSRSPLTLDGIGGAVEWLARVPGIAVVAIHDLRHVGALKALLGRLRVARETPPVVLALDFRVAQRLAREQIPFETPEQFVDAGDYDGIGVEAMAAGRQWPLALDPEGREDPTVDRGISLAELLQWEMTYFFAEAMRCLVNMQRLIERHHPSAMLFLESPAAPPRDCLRQEGEDLHRIAAQTLHSGETELARLRLPAQHQPGPRSIAWRTDTIFRRGVGRVVSAATRQHLRATGVGSTKRPILISGIKHIGEEVANRLALEHRAVVAVAEEAWSARRWWRMRRHWMQGADHDALPKKTRRDVNIRLELITAGLRRSRGPVAALTFRGAPLALFLEARLESLVNGRLQALAMEAERWRRFLESNRIGLVVVNEDLTPKPKTLVRVAQQLGIPTVVVQHGVYVHPTDAVLNADTMAAWGPATRRLLEGAGVAAERIRVVGASRFDALADLVLRRARIRREVCRELRLDPDRPVALFTAQGVRQATRFPDCHVSPQENLELCRLAVRAAGQLPDTQLIVKYHVMEPHARLIEEILRSEGLGGRARFLQHADIYRLLCAADVVMTGWSTTGLEAMALDIPLIVVRVRPQPYRMPYAQPGVALEARTVEELSDALRTVVRTRGGESDAASARKRFIEDWCAGPSGTASRALAAELVSLGRVP